MGDRQFVVSGRWALAADSLQWMLQRQYMNKGQPAWHSVSFVASTRDVLARCMRERGCPPANAERLLAGLPPPSRNGPRRELRQSQRRFWSRGKPPPLNARGTAH